jgi:hypothetical protein
MDVYIEAFKEVWVYLAFIIFIYWIGRSGRIE